MTSPISGSDTTFTRARNGYNPTEVNERIKQLVDMHNESAHTARALKKENEAVKRSLSEANSMVASLDREVSALKNAPTVPQATTDKMAKMLRVAIDEAARMENEARAESAEIIAAAHADAEMLRARHHDMLAEASAQQATLEAECAEMLDRARVEAERVIAEAINESDQLRMAAIVHREKAEAELSEEIKNIRAEAHAEAARHLAGADQKIRHRTADIDRTLDNLKTQKIEILEQLVKIYGRLEGMPSALESAYQDRDNNPVTVTMISPTLTIGPHEHTTTNEHESGNWPESSPDVPSEQEHEQRQ